jgi:hypothetical protein
LSLDFVSGDFSVTIIGMASSFSFLLEEQRAGSPYELFFLVTKESRQVVIAMFRFGQQFVFSGPQASTEARS